MFMILQRMRFQVGDLVFYSIFVLWPGAHGKVGLRGDWCGNGGSHAVSTGKMFGSLFVALKPHRMTFQNSFHDAPLHDDTAQLNPCVRKKNWRERCMHPSRTNFYLADARRALINVCCLVCWLTNWAKSRPHSCVYGVIGLFEDEPQVLKFRCELWSDFGRTFVNCE